MVSRIALIFSCAVVGACAYQAGKAEEQASYGVTYPAPAGDAGAVQAYGLPGNCVPIFPDEHPTWFVCEILAPVPPGDPAPLPGDPEKR